MVKRVAGVQWGQNIQTIVIRLWHTFESIDQKLDKQQIWVFLKFWSKIAILDHFKVHFSGYIEYHPEWITETKKIWFVRMIYDAVFIPQNVSSRFIWLLKAFCRCPFFQNIYVCSLLCTRMCINVPPNKYLCTSTQTLKCFQVRTQE